MVRAVTIFGWINSSFTIDAPIGDAFAAEGKHPK